MTRIKLSKAAAGTLATLGTAIALAGVAGASSNTTGTMTNTGPYSDNKVKTINESRVDWRNNNRVGVGNMNGQSANSGSANVSGNTNAGSAKTGDAANKNSFSTSVSLKNANPAAGMSWNNTTSAKMQNTGPYSDNEIVTVNKNSLRVENNNCVNVENSNEQSASTGSATVSGNTNGGSATTGSASNTSSSSTTVSISN